jgi:hypothetical protein
MMLARWRVLFSEARWSQRLDPTGSHLRLRRSPEFTSYVVVLSASSKLLLVSYTTNGQSASLSWCQAPIWDPQPIFLLLSLIIFRTLWALYFVEPSLTRWRVCNLLLLLVLASAVPLVLVLRDSRPYFIVPNFETPQPDGPGPRIKGFLMWGRVWNVLVQLLLELARAVTLEVRFDSIQ